MRLANICNQKSTFLAKFKMIPLDYSISTMTMIIGMELPVGV